MRGRGRVVQVHGVCAYYIVCVQEQVCVARRGRDVECRIRGEGEGGARSGV